MNKTFGKSAFAASVVLALTMQSAQAQVPLGPSAQARTSMAVIVPQIDLEMVHIDKAIQDAISGGGLKVVIAKDVQGVVTLSLRNVSREVVLQNILRQVDATYRLRGQTLEVMRRPEDLVPKEIASLLPPEKAALPLRRYVHAYSGVSVRTVLKDYFEPNGISYTISPDVEGLVNIELGTGAFDVAFEEIIRQVNATYLIEGGVYKIVRRN